MPETNTMEQGMADLYDQMEGQDQEQQADPATAEPTQEPPAEVPAQEAPAPGRARDEGGRFAREAPKPATVKPTPKVPAAKPEPTATPAPQEAVPTQADRAPVQWVPGGREQWKSLPQEVRTAILRREGEFARFRNEAEPVLRGAQQFQEVLRPYMPHFEAAGVQPIQHVQTMLRTDYALRSAPEPQRAAMFAQLMNTYGVSVQALDNALVQGGAQGAQPQPALPPQDPRLDHLLSAIQQRKQRATQASQQQMSEEIHSFASDPANEFFEDVRATMADLMDTYEAAAARAEREGRPAPKRPALKDLYQQALTFPAHAEILKVLEARKADEAKRAQAQQVGRARTAASSIRSQPAPPQGSRKPSMEEYMAQEWKG